VAPKGTTLEVRGVHVTVAETDAEAREEVGSVADAFRQGNTRSVLILFGTAGRGAVHVAVTDDLISTGKKAGDLVNRIAAVSGGKGGGRPQFASAGVAAGGLAAARDAVPGLVDAWLGGEA
jgi:alanyl-tRNA synthetase